MLETVHILSRLDRHEEALQIYALKIKNWKLAENYCLQHYERSNLKSNQLFTILYDLYEKHGNPKTSEKLMFLNKFGFRMIFKDVLSGLGQGLGFCDINPFLLKNIRSLSDSASMQNLLGRLLSVQRENVIIALIQAKYKLLAAVSKSIVCDEDTMCRICLKRLSSTLCTVYPDGRICHTYCAARLEEDLPA